MTHVKILPSDFSVFTKIITGKNYKVKILTSDFTSSKFSTKLHVKILTNDFTSTY